MTERPQSPVQRGPIPGLIRFCMHNRLVVVLLVLVLIGWGLVVAPFDWDLGRLPRDPVPVDAIPDIGENQQIVFAEWMGRSPQDVEDQVAYPLTTALLGIPGVQTVRSYSMFGFATVYVIFKEHVDFYWARSRVLERLAALGADTLPDGVRPILGPDATALGQVFWYTLEGRDDQGSPTGGWDLHELRSVQDWHVRFALQSAEGISEVASVGGFVQEYQVDVDPDAMRAYGVTLQQVYDAVRLSNMEVGARTVEVNRVEYVVRGLGFIQDLGDIEDSVVAVHDGVPVFVRNVAHVSRGPAPRRGALDKGGVEAVGGVAVVRFRENPLAAIRNLKTKIAEIAPGLPQRIVVDFDRVTAADVEAFTRNQGFEAFADGKLDQDAWLDWWGTATEQERPDWAVRSRVTVVPFYDRTGLIYETLGTLRSALGQQILVTVIVILIMAMHLRSSLVISATLPLAVLVCFIAMRTFGVDANIVALSGIAIAIGTIVDMGVIICENILRRLEEAPPEANTRDVVLQAAAEVGSAVVTAILTTVVGFLPVFTMTGAEGRLFRPLAFTKTFALFASVLIALTVVPALAHALFTLRLPKRSGRRVWTLGLLMALGLLTAVTWRLDLGLVVMGLGAWHLLAPKIPRRVEAWVFRGMILILALAVGLLLTDQWLPLGPSAGFAANATVVLAPIAVLLGGFAILTRVYPILLRWFLDHKPAFLFLPLVVVSWGLLVWLGAPRLLGRLPEPVRRTALYRAVYHAFPGLGKEFMPSLDEGSFLYMPTTMPHASIGEALSVLQLQDRAFAAIPEVEEAVGKIGRAETPLDPAPVSMIETVVSYKNEYLLDEDGRRLRFRFDRDAVDLARDEHGVPFPAPDGEPYQVKGAFAYVNGGLVPDPKGTPFRLWRPPLDPNLNPGRQAWAGIRSPDDIWDELIRAGEVPGTTSAPRLQPIAARLVMLQSGMRAPLGIKVKGPDLETIEQVALRLEELLREVPAVEPSTVLADRIVGKPYLEIRIDRQAIARYGLPLRRVQDVIEIAVGGRRIMTTVEGRERYPVRVRYLRELRDSVEALERVLVPASADEQIPLGELAEIRFVRGPQMIKSEDTFLVGYVIFDKRQGVAEVDTVEACRRFLDQCLADGRLQLPAGVSYSFAGSYQNQVRAARTLSIVLPLALILIFLILYFQFHSVATTFMVFSGILVAWGGGFILVWFYGQDWFLDVALFGTNLRDLFQIGTVNLSVAIWVGFLALFGIASDDGVVIASYLDQSFEARTPETVREIREATVAAAMRRIRPCLMTSATTILALMPVLTATGRGSDIMVPMAIPTFGGMLVVLISVFMTPVLYCARAEMRLALARLSR